MLKKLLYGFALLAAAVSCSDDNYVWENLPQHNDQPNTVTFGNGSISEVGVIDFATIADDQEYVKVCNIVAPTSDNPAYDAPSYEIIFNNTDVFNLNENGEMKAADLKKYVEDKFGKAPNLHEIPVFVRQWISNGNTTIELAASDAFDVKAKLSAPEISEHYYLIGDPSKWDPACTDLPFEHSDKNVYDDPIFTVTFSTACADANGDIWFAVADDKTVASNDLSMVLGAKEGNGANKIGETGLIARRSEIGNDGSFKVHVGDAKAIKMTLNMMDGTYLIETIDYTPFIYFIGSTDGWSASDQKLALTDVNNGLYTGYCYVADPNGWGLAFKFQRAAGSWDNEINAGTFTSKTGVTGDNNIEVAEEGLYYFEVSLGAGSISATKINNMNLVGDFNGWKQADDAQQMTWNAEELCFEKQNAGVSANGWKFTANNDWGINLGGAVDNLVGNGDNLKAVGSTIKLYPCRNTSDNIYCTVE